MGKWTCRCGHSMNDHSAPDPKCYLVYSDITWNKIEPDNNHNVNFYELPVPDYDAYVCPNCGRIMLFDGKGNQCISYRPEIE